MNKSLSLMVQLYDQKSNNFMGVFSENMSMYSLKAVGNTTISLIAPWAIIIDIVIHLMMNSRMQSFALKNLAHCSGAQVLKVLYSISLM